MGFLNVPGPRSEGEYRMVAEFFHGNIFRMSLNDRTTFNVLHFGVEKS